MEPQILIPPQIAAGTSDFLIIVQHLLPATIQVDGLFGNETVVIKSVGGFAFGLLTLSAIPAIGNTVTIAGRIYTFVDDVVAENVDGNVFRGTDAESAIDNLIAAINLSAGAGSLYAESTTENLEVSASDAASVDDMFATAKVFGEAGSRIAITGTGVASWSTGNLIATTSPVQEDGEIITLTATNNRIAINSPLRIQAEKELTTIPVSVTVAYGNKV